MSVTLRIAVRFLVAKRRAMLMTLAGIAFGIAFFILTQAQTAGFERFFIRTILGSDGALRVTDRFQSADTAQPYVEGVPYPAEVKSALLAHEEITGVAEVLKGSLTLESKARRMDAQALGILTDEYRAVSVLETQIVAGSMEEFARDKSSVLLGYELARRSGVSVGDYVTLSRGDSAQRLLVAGIFETGVGDIDRVRVFLHLDELRRILNQPFGASYLQVAVDDHERAPQLAARLEETLRHSVAPWQRREKVWLEVFRALRISSAVTVMTIVVVSALGMYNTLAMLVMEKTREIAILRSMGYTRADIRAIFVRLGLVVLTLGATAGCLLGALLTEAVSHVPMRVRGIFSTDRFVVSWEPEHYVSAVACAAVVILLAAYFPARRAARIEPGEIIRGTSS